jgi:hypothetical protein
MISCLILSRIKVHYVVMDSAYMSDVMCQVGREEWKIDMVGTYQTDWCGASPLGKAACKAKEIEINTHESLLYQHNTKPLSYAVRGDNNFVKTLSNFHSPAILKGGMRRKKRNLLTKKREWEFSGVDCPEQQKSYCNTYHKIDKGNGTEAKYDLSTESHLHGWGPKLTVWFFNMNTNNSYKIYCSLYKKYHPGRDPMELKDCINNLTHSLLHFNKAMIWGREPVELHQVLLRTWYLLLQVTGEVLKLMLRTNRLHQYTVHMVLEEYMPVLLKHRLLLSLLEVSTIKNLLLINERGRDYIRRVHQPMLMIVRGTGEKSGSGARWDYKKWWDEPFVLILLHH